MLDYRSDFIGSSIQQLQTASGVIPVNGVYRVAFGAGSAFTVTAVNAVLGARAVKNDSGTVRLFLGSVTNIEEVTGSGTIIDRSKALGYNASTTRWWFSQGIAANEVVAANSLNTIQRSTGTAFSDLTNAPKCKVVLAQSEALLALNYDDGTAVPNGIKISDRGDSTVWTPSASNDAAAIRLVESPGEIVAGATLNDLVVVWKKNSMYVGRFVGGDEKWQFNLLSPYIGCFGQEAWAATPSGIIFSGPAGTYIFDGSVPRAIDRGMRQQMLDYVGSSNSWGANIQISHDEYNTCAFVWIPDPVGGANNFECFAYNYLYDKWSRPYPMRDEANNTTYDFGLTGVSDLQCIVRDMGVMEYASLVGASTAGIGHFVIASDKKIYNLAEWIGNSFKSVGKVRTGRFKLSGAPNAEMTLRRVYPIFASSDLQTLSPPSTMTCTVQAYDVEQYTRGAPASTTTATWDSTAKRFDVFATGKVFDVTISGSVGGLFGLVDVKVDMVPAGAT